MTMIDQRSGRRVEGLQPQLLDRYARLHGMTPEDALNKIALANMTAGNVEDTVRTLQETERQYSQRAAAGESAAAIREERAKAGAAMQGGPSNADIRSFAAEQGIPEQNARGILQRYQQNPASKEFANFTPEQRRSADIAVSGLTYGGAEKAPRQEKLYIKQPTARERAAAAKERGQALMDWVAFEAELKVAPEYLRTAYEKGGINEFSRALEVYNRMAEKQRQIFQDELDRMPGDVQVAYYTGGMTGLKEATEAYNANIQAAQDRYDKARVALEPYRNKDGTYAINDFLKKGTAPDGMTKTETLAAMNYSGEAIKEAQFWSEKNAIQRFGIAMTPWKEEKGETVGSGEVRWVNVRDGKVIPDAEYRQLGADQGFYVMDLSPAAGGTVKNVTVMAADIAVPGYRTIREWNELSTGMKALSIAMDAAMLVPFAGAAVKGAREVASAGRAAMLAGAAKGVAREAGAMVTAPVNMIIHPVASAKAGARTARNLFENILSPGKLPEVILTTSNHVVAFKVTNKTTAAEYIAMMDELTSLAAKGERPVAIINGQVVELARSPFMKTAGGGLVHVTPDLEKLLASGKVAAKPGMPAKEQGWFLSTEPAVTFTEGAAFGKGKIPVPEYSDRLMNVAKYRPEDIVRVDKAAVRPLNFADARNIPDNIARQIQAYAVKNDATLYGSFNEWLKVKGAARPNDFDLVFKNADQAIDDIMAIAKRAGYKARKVPHGIEILRDGEWVKIGDIASISQHKEMLPLPMYSNKVEGLNVETLGKQYIGQSYGAVEGGAKAAERLKRLNKAANDVKKILKKEGFDPMQPGIVVTSPEYAAKTVSTEKLYHSTVEAERKAVIGADIPQPKQRLYTRINGTKVVVALEKPLTMRQVAKLKAQALVETIAAPFKPAITVKGAGDINLLTTSEIEGLAGVLKASGNADQAAELTRAFTGTVARTPRPSLREVIGRVDASEVARARASLLRQLSPAQLRQLTGTAEMARIAPARGRPERITGADYRRMVAAERVLNRANEVMRQQARAMEREAVRLEKRAPERAAALRETARTLTARIVKTRELARAARQEVTRRVGRTPGTPQAPRTPARVERGEIPRTPPPPRTEGRPPEPPRPPERIPRRPPPPRIRLRLGRDSGKPQKLPNIKLASNEEKRKYLETAPDFRAYRRGKLGDMDVWHVWIPPYQSKDTDRIILLGPPPQGVRPMQGPGSARGTLYGRGKGPAKPLMIDTGAVDDIMSPGPKLRHIRDASVRHPRGNGRKPKPKPLYPSVKRGPLFYTNLGNTTGISRRPIRSRT